VPALVLGRVQIEKRLPVAAGIGGGSADAAAVLRAVRHANPSVASAVDWLALAASLGADVPVCLASTAQLMWGIGRETAPLPSLPPLPAVLVNPRVPLATAAVFQALGAPPAPARIAAPSVPGPFPNPAAVAAYVNAHGNDLEPAAKALCPAIAAVLAALGFETARAAESAAQRIRAEEPGWWTVATTLR
jgi:4-diphosphocytidyl-2-C-methyl-D-erythritol kinase